MERAIILAAGKGQRLVNGLPFPKPLIRVGGVPLIVRVLRNLERAGLREAVVVVGHQEEVLRRGVARYEFDLDVTFVHNADHDGPDGLSLLAARDYVSGPTLLVMGDTLTAPEMLLPLISYPLDTGASVVAVDFADEHCVDLDAAVKVAVDDSHVTALGKGLQGYDALSTGALTVTPALLSAIEQSEAKSLEAGLRTLAAMGSLQAVSIGGARWIDVDTRAAHGHAERAVARYGDALQPTPMVAGL